MHSIPNQIIIENISIIKIHLPVYQLFFLEIAPINIVLWNISVDYTNKRINAIHTVNKNLPLKSFVKSLLILFI